MSYLDRLFEKEAFLGSQEIVKNLSKDALLDTVQKRTLGFFTDFTHSRHGMAFERSDFSPAYSHRHTVTTGGTGFAIMAMICGVERGWLRRKFLVNRVAGICKFLNQSDSYHGVFPHFMNVYTGETIAFSAKDDGADLVETSFLMMGLLCARNYLAADNPQLAEEIDILWRNVQWDHHMRPEKKDFLWHWSPKFGYEMDHKIEGWNECLLTYILAAASPDHAISPELYHSVWAKGKEFRNGNKYYGQELPLGPELGGPLFTSQYSFMGIDPRGLKDEYANYEEQNKAHAKINYQHCCENPFRFEGYGPHCWGLTASDSTPFEGRRAYRAHSPIEDYGVISPTAALSSFPYTPKESMEALRHFYEDRGESIFSRYGFVDAFHAASGWKSKSYLAIDQGPIVVMIENYRSGLLWNIGMSLPEVQRGLQLLGFKSPYLTGPDFETMGEACALPASAPSSHNQTFPAQIPCNGAHP